MSHVRKSKIERYIKRLESRYLGYSYTSDEYRTKGDKTFQDHYQAKAETLKEIIQDLKEEFNV
ncbi:hypothetical protein E8L90_29625 [Brevibacillus antibioticus]|uniref:Uncharacterized protein n=1 Tax=Brevibacillus antibioticus TaxID=2570228 RepID=A0A4U2XYD8_9BACL|nr:hypothetical protein [Brevibacillus antibioticus]TKI52917.1 hypothetical protein E8L90_29625 [Brevibacillus antibioticus]